jgi:hypothetical protein
MHYRLSVSHGVFHVILALPFVPFLCIFSGFCVVSLFTVRIILSVAVSTLVPSTQQAGHFLPTVNAPGLCSIDQINHSSSPGQKMDILK